MKQFLELRDTPFCFHQVLTFRGAMTDRLAAKNALASLLDVLHKQFYMVSLFTEQGHANKRIHFHVVFLFYPPQPETPEALIKNFGATVFKHWHRLTGGAVVRQANRITLWKKELTLLRYILREVVPLATQRERGQVLWHGKRNKKLMAAQSSPVTNREIRAAIRFCFPHLDDYRPVKFYNDWTKHGPQYYGKAKLRELRTTVEARGESWRKFKDGQTGVRNCPDRDYREWLNRKIDSEANTI
ncbi:MAG TPA: hypothetical protein P5205_08735 [Candidatus Paceibacterota bacterium]|nr:hypothetical protein [Verrucomicrobiota bacterium]HSA10444.1 hypothetical protein [Candidatus Paceibacterota bacterium]